jgi:hypothetical protein
MPRFTFPDLDDHPSERNALAIAALRVCADDHADADPVMHLAISESFHCSRCERQMRREFVLSQVIGQNLSTAGSPVRMVRGYCEHCGLLFEVNYTRRGFEWLPLDPGKIIKDQRIRSRHFALVRQALANAISLYQECPSAA